jgi:hypothetical protein
MAETRTYRLGAVTLDQVGRQAEELLRSKPDLFVESVNGPGGYLIQARLNGQDWRKFVGLDKAIQVQITPAEAGAINVTIGQGKWLDKLGAGAVGAIWFPPLAVVTGFGVWSQLKLVSDLFNQIQNFIIRGQ